MSGIESVKYRKELLELIDTRAASVNNLTLGLGILISMSAIFLVSNTIRLAIHAKRHLIRTMELVGATRGFIRTPFLLEGMLQGILGGAVASLLLYALLEYALRLVSVEISDAVHRDALFHGALLAGGCVLGLVGALLSVFRFMKSVST
jgi:cell division transport system permease protein